MTAPCPDCGEPLSDTTAGGVPRCAGCPPPDGQPEDRVPMVTGTYLLPEASWDSERDACRDLMARRLRDGATAQKHRPLGGIETHEIERGDGKVRIAARLRVEPHGLLPRVSQADVDAVIAGLEAGL